MDKETSSFQETQPDADDHWEYDTGSPRGRVLWGRIIALVVALVVAFLFGRATAGGDGSVSKASYAKVKRELQRAKAQIAGGGNTPVADETPEASPTPEPTASATSAKEKSYVVKSGDTLRGIALKFYGDASLDDVIAEANDITDPALLHEGLKLIIPPKP
jgi:LysM repeat protein